MKYLLVCHPLGVFVAEVPDGANVVAMYGTASAITEVTFGTFAALAAAGIKVDSHK
jgi:hypothetical protein